MQRGQYFEILVLVLDLVELTAVSSVAELAEKPLYRVTCGDIGTEVDDVERYLEEILSLGKRWDCGKNLLNSS